MITTAFFFFYLFQIFSLHLRKKREKTSYFVFSASDAISTVFKNRSNSPLVYCMICSICFHILQVLQNVGDRGKRGLIFNTRLTRKQRNRCSFESGKREVRGLPGMAVKL